MFLSFEFYFILFWVKVFNISTNNVIGVEAAKVLWYGTMESIMVVSSLYLRGRYGWCGIGSLLLLLYRNITTMPTIPSGLQP